MLRSSDALSPAPAGYHHAQDADVLEVASGKQRANSVTDIIVGHRIARTHWHTEEGRTNSDTLQAFEMNVLHHEPSAPYTVALLNSSDAMSNFFIAIVIMRSS